MAYPEHQPAHHFAQVTEVRPTECCCGCNVLTGTKLVALFSLFLDLLIAAILFYYLIPILRLGFHLDAYVIGGLVGSSLAVTVDTGFNFFLLKGANQENVRFCRIWIVYAILLVLIHLGLGIASLVIMPPYSVVYVVCVLAIAKYVYFIHVVSQFVNSMKGYHKDSHVSSPRFTQS